MKPGRSAEPGGQDGRDLEHRAYQLFAEALELPEPERTPFIDGVAGTDPRLHAEVAALLAADRQETGLLDGRAADLVPPDRRAENTSPGASLGGYQLEREIGVGGMGRVFEARKADGTLDRKVAIKVLKSGGWPQDRDERRFLDEGRALASLVHPNIARVFEAGVAAPADGPTSPYLVMELVDGVPITDYCRQAELGVEQRVELFLTVCDAVQTAHLQRLVHRDLKPPNILVDRQGTAKLLDFGIAKFLDRTSRESAMGSRMTPIYAAPEQLMGDEISPATDVYALGLLLYELLTGQRAVDVRDSDLVAIVRHVCHHEPPPPSAALGEDLGNSSRALSRLRQQLRGDLDTIVMKALHKTPAQRYGSAADLAADLRRWRQGQPVLARPTGAVERTVKLVRRRPLATAAVLFLVLTLAASVSLMQWQRRTADLQRQRAEQETEKANQVSELVRWLLVASSPSESLGADAPALDLLASGVERASSAPTPELQAELLAVLGRAYANLGHHEQSLPLLRRALVLRQQAGSPADELDELRRAIAGVTHGESGARPAELPP